MSKLGVTLLLPGFDSFLEPPKAKPVAPPAPVLPREVARSRRERELRPKVQPNRRLPVLVARDAWVEYPTQGVERPRTRGECEGGERPCPWVSCRYHLALDVTASGGLRETFPDLDVTEMKETCALDVADRAEDEGGLTLDEIGPLLNLTREGARKLEVSGLAKLREALSDDEGIDS